MELIITIVAAIICGLFTTTLVDTYSIRIKAIAAGIGMGLVFATAYHFGDVGLAYVEHIQIGLSHWWSIFTLDVTLYVAHKGGLVLGVAIFIVYIISIVIAVVLTERRNPVVSSTIVQVGALAGIFLAGAVSCL